MTAHLCRLAVVCGVFFSAYEATGAEPLSATEQRIVGTWSWTYIEGVGRIIFTSDHKVRIGFPPNLKDGRTIADDEFDIVQTGVWRLDGDALVTEINNTPLIKTIERLDPSNIPALEKKVERWKIAKIDGNKIVFDSGSSFDRVNPNVGNPTRVRNRKQQSATSRRLAPTVGLISAATESLPVVGLNDALQIPSNEISLLKRRAERGDHEAAIKLASYYGVYLSDKWKQVYYYELAAKGGSEVAVENLVTIYSRTDAYSFDFGKALAWRRRLKELARKKGVEIESDGEWGYGLYLDHLTDKDGGLFFLKYAAKHGSEKAKKELLETYSSNSG
jgi:hypothetical protein